MLNKFIIQARLSRDPQLITTEKNKILLFNLACNSSEKKDKVNFLDVKSFGKTAEFINKYFKKGRIGIFEGYISSGAYEKNGEKVYSANPTGIVLATKAVLVLAKKKENV